MLIQQIPEIEILEVGSRSASASWASEIWWGLHFDWHKIGHQKCPIQEICPTPIHRPRNTCTNITELSTSNPENLDKYYLVDNGK
jgi:hypothetical protein